MRDSDGSVIYNTNLNIMEEPEMYTSIYSPAMAPQFKDRSLESTITLEEKGQVYQPMTSAKITLDD